MRIDMELLDKFASRRVLVIGDIMLDRYWWGKVSRISPEAPVPVVRMDHETLAAGGAANVAANIAGLGAYPILIGVVGNDDESSLLPGVIEARSISSKHLVTAKGRRTTVKTRIIAHSQQVARIDNESDDSLNAEAETAVIAKFDSVLSQAAAIVISDYAKGTLTDNVTRHVIEAATGKQIPVLVDPKGRDYRKYRGATILTPNRREAADACGLEENTQDMVDIAGNRLLTDLDLQSVLVTQGEDGMTLFRTGQKPYHLHTLARDVYDVTGAGDTVIASLAVAIAAGADAAVAAEIANVAAGIVVEQVGTTAISLKGLREAFSTL
jgi:rfaE bifunctional protein kinase chain/domain